MRHKRTTSIRIALAVFGASALLASAARGQQQNISLSGEVKGGTASAMFSQTSAAPGGATIEQVKTLRIAEGKAFVVRFAAPTQGITGCQEFPANGRHALAEGGGWRPNGTTEIEVAPGNRLYPARGGEKWLVIRCVTASRQVVSDSIKIVR